MGSKFLINYLRQKWCDLQSLFVAPRLGCACAQPSCGLVKCVTSYVLLRHLIVNNKRGPLICTLARNCTIVQFVLRRILYTQKISDNSANKLLEFFRLISRVYYNQSAHTEPASEATPTLPGSATREDGLLSKATPPSAASAIVDSTPSRDITLRPDIGEFGTFDLQFDVSDTEYDSYVMDTSADMFA